VPVKAKAVLGPNPDEDDEEVEEDDFSTIDGLDAAADAEDDDEEDSTVRLLYISSANFTAIQHAACVGAFL
jgi:hypothetical protein